MTVHPLVLEQEDTTIHALHTRLVQIDDISKKDAIGNQLTLRANVWAPVTGIKRGPDVCHLISSKLSVWSINYSFDIK